MKETIATLLRRLRGMCGIGALWGIAWAPIGLAMAVGQMLLDGFGLPQLDVVVAILLSGLANGFGTGFLFSGGLMLAYRRRSLAEVRPSVLGVIGALAGLMLPGSMMLYITISDSFIVRPLTVIIPLVFGAALGAATAVGSLRLARAAPAELKDDGLTRYDQLG